MTEPDCDVAVVGGGIHGAGVAQAAAAAGCSVVLLERTAPAAGTSSRSSKLIHGGLRYLESAEFSLVRESLREREILLNIAPGLVRRQRFFVPVYRHTSRSRWWIGAGLSLYALLGLLRPDSLFRVVPRSQWSGLDGLATGGLKTVFQYTDAQTDDAALTRAVLRSARSLGAHLLCPASLVAGRLHDQHVELEYEEHGQRRRLTTRVVVNAAGPWAGRVAECVDPALPMVPVENVQGAHLELPGRVQRGCYYLEVSRDRRAVFAMPWRGDRTLLGTTEHPYRGDPGEVKVLDEEREYLLDTYRQYFPERPTEVLDEWAGLRVLPAAGGASFGRSRETHLPVDRERAPRAVSILGGKLTGYRATAEKVMETIRSSLPQRPHKADTRTLRLEPD